MTVILEIVVVHPTGCQDQTRFERTKIVVQSLGPFEDSRPFFVLSQLEREPDTQLSDGRNHNCRVRVFGLIQ